MLTAGKARPRWVHRRESQAHGIGGAAKTLGVVDLPICIGGVCGILRCVVVADEVPMLLPIGLLTALYAASLTVTT